MTNEEIIEEFEKKWFVKNGELEVETYLDLKDFILAALEAKDEKARQEKIELMKAKTNQEIMDELQTRGRFRTPEEVDTYFREDLESKDKQARQEKIELVDDLLWRVKDIGEDLQNPHVWDLDEWSTPVKNLKFIEVKLNKLKNDN